MTKATKNWEPWPELAYADWGATADTLHMWTQIVGKVRLALSPWVNHSWHVTLYVTPTGLTTGAMPAGSRTIEIAFDLVSHRLQLVASDGRAGDIPLRPMTVASFYAELMAQLEALDCGVTIIKTPNEVPNPIRFDEDEVHESYDPAFASRFSAVLNSAHRVMSEFRAGFLGKCSPVHFFWGSFDLAVTRFSGRKAPEHPGGVEGLPDWVTREAYSHEVSSAGFWPGNADAPPLFYSYAYPTPEEFGARKVRPEAASFSEELGEFVLPYDAVRQASSPDAALMEFLESTYEAASDLAKWERDSLDFSLR
ncbi:MAG: DUF5996 family protein [Myxococcota bacterium]